MTKKFITKDEYYQIIGLLTLGRNFRDKIVDVEKSLGELIEVEEDNGYYGHVSDAIYENYSVNHLLKLLEIGTVDLD